MIQDILDLFDAVYVINIDTRTDKMKSFTDNLIRAGVSEHYIKEKIKRFSGIIPHDKNGARGCLMSHVAVIREAKEMNYKNIFIFEDDALHTGLIDNFVLPEQWDMIFFGYHPLVLLHRSEKNYLSAHECLCTHAYAVNNTVYDMILKAYDNDEIKIIDMWYMKVVQEKQKCLCSYPMIFKQAHGYSDIENRNVDYEFLMDRYSRSTSHLKNNSNT